VKAVILAGGKGTRLGLAAGTAPKPMIEIGAKPILWHIMKIYSAYNIVDFIICCGYRGHVIREYFASYALHQSDVTFDLKRGEAEFHRYGAESWRVTLLDTGEETMTGGRIKRVRDYLSEETFLLTYGDGLADIDITALISFHRQQGRAATLTAVHRPRLFGALRLSDSGTDVRSFHECSLPDGISDWINGGFFVLEPDIFQYIESDRTVWEYEPLTHLASTGQLSAFRHDGFWQPLDTVRDHQILEQLWSTGRAPWKCW
jgi:glucose-1-phosphate cytidylyltransferase